MNEKRASRRICACCKGVYSNDRMTRRGKRYICPVCVATAKQNRVLRRARAKWPEEVTT